MPTRSVEDRLREEYFTLLPNIRQVLEHLEVAIRYRLLPVSRKLHKFERLDVSSRIKECESAIETLRRRQEGAIFYPDHAGSYTLTSLKDLAGARVLVFPRYRMEEIDSILRETFPAPDWTSDPVMGDHGETLALKYWGHCAEASNTILAEYQIVSVLTGLFWNIEHAAIYKPSPQLKDVAQSLSMQQRSRNVLEALGAFEEEFERLIRADSLG